MLPVPSSIAPEEYYAYYGHTGATAYFGLELATPRPNDVLVVSSAAGGVGALVGQMGKCVGCSHVIGIAGSDERCRWIVEELGFDAAINYTREHVAERLQELCPAGIDIYFDNVGGGLLDTVLTMLARNARIALCGELATYNTPASSAITNTFQLTLQRASMHGFLVTDYLSRYAEAFDQITVWRTQGRMRTGLTILDGIEQLAPALERLFAGAYLGKVVIRV
ncbi:MAG: NADP-dependent oxidoreductase [Chloroflexaceae bacterium]|nr:NADP-dependent oxidoreductase [Chloroflexaceae bacterium]NJL33609.1 NADP-dependent oxidoreductase [Chloroflexaceae bacterium]NJO07063.1 NADP-dependent oxidoreductase [Chloroflexaceae bacterium]